MLIDSLIKTDCLLCPRLFGLFSMPVFPLLLL